MKYTSNSRRHTANADVNAKANFYIVCVSKTLPRQTKILFFFSKNFFLTTFKITKLAVVNSVSSFILT